MEEIDKVLEAEKAIKDIAEELKRMKSAADLMDNAQEKIDAVISASQEIINKTDAFVKAGTQIVERIGDYDIQNDLNQIITRSEEIRADTQAALESLNALLEKIKIQSNDLKENFKTVESNHNKMINRFDNIIQELNVFKKNIKESEVNVNKTVDTCISKLNDDQKRYNNLLDQALTKNKKLITFLLGAVGFNILLSIIMILSKFGLF